MQEKLRQFLPKKTATEGLKDKKWLLLVLCAVALALLLFGYKHRPVVQESVTLLTGQSYTLPKGGRIRVQGKGVEQDDHVLTGAQEGKATVRVDRLTRVEKYTFVVYDPVPQGTAEQRVGVDGSLTVGAHTGEYPVVWTSADERIATVEDGEVHGVSPGTVTVTETLNDWLTYTYTITVTQPELERDKFTVYPGQTVPLNVRYYSQQVDWTADSDAVTIQADGSVQAKRPGTARLTTVLGDVELSCTVQVAQPPRMARQLVLRTDETDRLYVNNAVDGVRFHSEDENIVTVDQWGQITPVHSGATQVTARTGGVELTARVVVNLTPEEEFRVNNYGPYQPDTSIAALAMLGMCDYYNDRMRADNHNWVDTNLTSFSPKDTFEEEYHAGRKGANCNSLLNWSWHDMDIKSGHGSKLYGERDSGKIHGYNGSDKSLHGLVDGICTVTATHGTRTRSLERSGRLKPGDMLFMDLHTFIYRGDGTVFASAGDAKCKRKGGNLIFLNWINGGSSYDWNRRISYHMRFNDDYIPPKYRNKDGEVVDNPMYLAKERGDSPWTGKRSPAERRNAGLEPVTFTLGEAEQAEAEQESDTAAAQQETAQQDADQPADGKENARADSADADAAKTDAADAVQWAEPITGDIVAEVPVEEEPEPEPPTKVGGKTYGSHPSLGKVKKKRHKNKHKSKKQEKTEKTAEKSAE